MGNFPYYDEPTHDTGTPAVGARDTSISLAEGTLKLDVVDKIFTLEPAATPFTTMLTQTGQRMNGATYKDLGIPKASTGNPEFKWLEDRYAGRYAKVSTVVGTTTTLTLGVTGAGASSGYIFTVGDVVKNARTGENFLVDTVASATSITVATVGRAFGTTAAATPLAGDGLYIIGNVSEENSGARNVNMTRVSTESNYTQIFKKTISLSGTESEADEYGGDPLPRLRKKMAIEHLQDIERTFIWGEKKSTTKNGHPIRSTGGVLEFIKTGGSYIQDQGGPLTAPDMNIFLREGFTYQSTSGRKVLMCGGIVINAISEIARGQLRDSIVQGDSYGIVITQWVSPFGTIDIVQNPFLINDYAGYAFLLDMDCFRYRFMKNRDTRLMTNVQAPDVDGQIDQYITECGLERKNAAN